MILRRMTPLFTQAEYDEARSATLQLLGGCSIKGDVDDALANDADSTHPLSGNRPIFATLFDTSITRAPFDWCCGDLSEHLSYSENDSEDRIWEEPCAVFMASNDPPPPPPDPFSTPIHADLTQIEVGAARKALEEARVKEQRE
jgi:hypothetical protein